MRTFFEAVGVDFDQWKALTRAALKTDWRASSLGGATLNSGRHNRNAVMFSLAAFYLTTGAFATVLVVAIRNVMLSGTMILTYLMFMVGSMILIDHNSVITSPDDYSVLGFRPVSSRTFFAVRLANVFVYTLALTTAYGLIPMAAFGVVQGLRVGIAAPLAFYLSTVFTTLTLVFVYAGMLRAFGAHRVRRALSYLQLVMGFMVYGGYFMMSQFFDRRTLEAMALPDSPLVYLFPPTWFASYLAVAAGHGDARTMAAAAASIVSIAVLALFLGTKLSLNYAEQLGALSVASAARPAKPARHGRPIWFRTAESRAIALLVRAQFRNDQKFRMAVLSVLPLTIIYVLMALRHGPLPDPFAIDWDRAPDVMLITLAVLLFPMTLRLNLARSDSYRASWIYYACPVERSRLVRATTAVIVGFFLVPYLAAVAAFVGYFTGHLVHVIVHLFFLGLVSHLFLQGMMLLDPALPFSQPVQKGTRSGMMFVSMALVMVCGFVLVPLLSMFVYVSVVRIGIAAGLIVAASATVDRITRLRVDRLAEGMEFGG